MDTTTMLLLAPLVLVQITLQVMALYDLYQRKQVRSLSIPIWMAIIILFTIPGPVAYFVLGRVEETELEKNL